MSISTKKHPNPINQHWVPRFYLSYFATPETRETAEPQVWIFSKRDEDGEEKLTNVRNVCAKRYLYSPVQDDGERSWDLESRLNDVETLLAMRWPEFAHGFASLDDEHVRMGISLFVAIMHTRNPAVRQHVETLHQAIVDAYRDAPLRADGTPDVDEVEINGKIFPVDTSGWHDYRAWGKKEHDLFFVDMVRKETGHIAELLMKMRWSVVMADADCFITSDKPVGMLHHNSEKFGFATPGVIVTFPLSPRRMLIMDDLHHEPANQYYPLHEGNAGPFNMTIWHSGSRFMITGRPIPDVLSELVALENK